MRFEAKHSYFKRLAQTLGNFINLPYSLAMRHQQLQCYWSTNDREIPGAGLTVGPRTCLYVSIMCVVQYIFGFDVGAHPLLHST